jgi:hypothetical protein
MDTKRWWLIGVATVLVALMVVDSVGWMAGVGLGVACLAGPVIYTIYRKKHPPKGPTVVCVRCGETLSSTARQCQYCGSASWTIIE